MLMSACLTKAEAGVSLKYLVPLGAIGIAYGGGRARRWELGARSAGESSTRFSAIERWALRLVFSTLLCPSPVQPAGGSASAKAAARFVPRCGRKRPQVSPQPAAPHRAMGNRRRLVDYNTINCL